MQFSLATRVIAYTEAIASSTASHNEGTSTTTSSAPHSAATTPRASAVSWKGGLHVTHCWTESSQRCLWRARVPNHHPASAAGERTGASTAAAGGYEKKHPRGPNRIHSITEAQDELYRMDVVYDGASTTPSPTGTDVANLFVLQLEGYELKPTELGDALGAGTAEFSSKIAADWTTRKVRLLTLRFPNEQTLTQWCQVLDLCVAEDSLRFDVEQLQQQQQQQQSGGTTTPTTTAAATALPPSVHPHRGKKRSEVELLLRQLQVECFGAGDGSGSIAIHRAASGRTQWQRYREASSIRKRWLWWWWWSAIGILDTDFEQEEEEVLRYPHPPSNKHRQPTTSFVSINARHSAVTSARTSARVTGSGVLRDLPRVTCPVAARGADVSRSSSWWKDVSGTTTPTTKQSPPSAERAEELLRYETVQLRWRLCSSRTPAQSRPPSDDPESLTEEILRT